MEHEKWKSQLRKGAAELAVLSMIEREPLSGTAMLDRLEAYAEIGLSGGTIYPLLNRLEREKRVKSKWLVPDEGGHPKKLYTLTNEGRAALRVMRNVWIGFRDDLSSLVEAKK